MLSFLDSTQRHQLGITDQIGISDFFRGHETSHQWWGHRVGWKSYHDQWLSEGIAQFSGNLYVQFRRNFGEYLSRIREDRRDLAGRDLKNRAFESLGPIWMGTRLSSADAPDGYSKVIYSKGGLVLHTLRMLFWDSRAQNPDHIFIKAMKDFTNTFHNQPASTEDFKAVLEKHLPKPLDLEDNGRLDWFFRQYVYGTGIPEYQFKYSVAPAGENQWKVTGSVTQSGVPEGWLDVLPVYVQSGQRTIRLGSIAIGGRQTPIDVTIPLKPDKLLLNMNEDTLAEIKQ